MRKCVLWLIVAMVPGAFLQCASDYGASSTQTTTDYARSPAAPLPLDPLSQAESETALRIARSDPRVREILGGDGRVIYVHSIAPKNGNDDPRGRHANVLLRRTDTQAGVIVLVDLVAGRVVEAVRQTRVALGESDIEEAVAIAVEHPALQQLLGVRARGFTVLSGPIGPHNANSNFVEGLQHIAGDPSDPCYTNRCIYLLFNSGGQLILQDQEILVDLTTRQARVTPARPGGYR